MKTELLCLVAVSAFTGILWLPYVMERVLSGTFSRYVRYHGERPSGESAWAQRLVRAHANAVENLVVFAPLVLTANALGITNSLVVNACVVYLIARVVHAVAFALAIPWVRTVAFVVGFACQAVLAVQILSRG